MIEVKELSYSIPEKVLYDKVSFHIENDAHYALIGSNGTGKSTLVDLLLNEDQYLYKGKIIYSDAFRNNRIGFVSQFSQNYEKEDLTVFEYISEEFLQLEQKIGDLCERMATETDLDAVFEAYQNALDQKDAIDGDHYDTNIKKQLKLAGIEKLENQKLALLSGGEFKLVQVIKELLLSPKIIFMDEPDVFLDFDHVNALKDLINAHKGTIMVITHNRYLLNHCFDHILHLEGCGIQEFEGSYVAYKYELLSAKIDCLEVVAKEEEEIDRQQSIVNRIRASATIMDNASLGRSVHARQTLLDRLKDRKTKLPFIEIEQPNIVFEVEETEEKIEGPILALKDYEVAFDEQLLEHVDFDMLPTDKVAIVGKNGTGKTTLLREISKADKSSINIHPKAHMGIFSQITGTVMDADQNITAILEKHGLEKKNDIVSYMQQYGFDEEYLTKRVGELSGGEKDLFQLAVMSLGKANLLLLDEPTGHLDLYAQDALESAIRDYQGGVLMVSHDFYLVANCMDYVLLVEDNQIRRMSIRKFRQMIYTKHFDKDFLLIEDKKKELELRIEKLVHKRDYETAQNVLCQLEPIVKKLDKTIL